MSQMDKSAQAQNAATTSKKNDCRALQQSLGPRETYKIQQEVYCEWLDRMHRNFIAWSLEPILCQPDNRSFNTFISDLFIGTGGTLRLRRSLGIEAPTYSVDISGMYRTSSHKSRVTTLPGFMLACTQGQRRPQRLPPRSLPCLPSLSQPVSTRRTLEYPLTEVIGQRPEGDGRDGGRGRGYECSRSASGSSHSHSRIETLTNSRIPEAELGVISLHAPPSEGTGSRTSTRPASLSSLYGCALVNEEDYVTEDQWDCEEDDWDECGMSSSEE